MTLVRGGLLGGRIQAGGFGTLGWGSEAHERPGHPAWGTGEGPR